jgi:cysteine-rich repeat protein
MKMRRGFFSDEVWVFTLLAIALAAAACVKEPGAVSCPTGIYCPAGAGCALNQAVCIFDSCGNGVLDPGEKCDDGNLIDGDGCSSTCQSTEVCGNGIVDKRVGEECDDGNLIDGDGCSSTCKSEVCGNGILDSGEQCDGHGETSYCNANCTISRCGDGILNVHANEQCDDGNTSDNDDCTSKCVLAQCGDGFVDGVLTSSRFEECDFGTGTSGNSDSPDCPYGELTCARCSKTASAPPGAYENNSPGPCRWLKPIPHYCGNGVIEVTSPTTGAVEPCDDARSFACGTCTVVDPSTCRIVQAANATGTVWVNDKNAVQDGDTVTVPDGTGTVVAFEFEVSGVCTTTDTLRCIHVANGDNEHDLACKLSTAIGNAPNFNVGATCNLKHATLTNSAAGILGNQAIVVSVKTTNAITKSDMKGGVGCSAGDACAQPSDCVDPLTCGTTSGACE